MATDRRASGLRRVLRTIAWAIAIAFGVGFLIGTLLRRELDRPVRYIGAMDASALAADPCDVLDSLTCVLVSSHHEEQV